MLLRIIFILFLAFFSVNSLAQAYNTNKRDFFIGLNCIIKNFPLPRLQSGLNFPIYQKNGFNLQAGPQINLSLISDLDAFIEAAYQISYQVNLYTKLPLGYTLAFGGGAGAGGLVHGFNIGLLPGLKIDFSKRYGMYIEIGYVSHFFPEKHLPLGSVSMGLVVKF